MAEQDELKIDALMLAATISKGVAEATSVWGWEAGSEADLLTAPNGWRVRIVADGRHLWDHPFGTPVFLGRDFFRMEGYAAAVSMLKAGRLRLHYWDSPALAAEADPAAAPEPELPL